MECLIENLICTWDSPLGIISKIVLSLQPENKEYIPYTTKQTHYLTFASN